MELWNVYCMRVKIWSNKVKFLVFYCELYIVIELLGRGFWFIKNIFWKILGNL